MAELKSITFSMSYSLQMPVLDPPAESAAATNMGFILTACFCTSLLVWLTQMSQVPVEDEGPWLITEAARVGCARV